MILSDLTAMIHWWSTISPWVPPPLSSFPSSSFPHPFPAPVNNSLFHRFISNKESGLINLLFFQWVARNKIIPKPSLPVLLLRKPSLNTNLCWFPYQVGLKFTLPFLLTIFSELRSCYAHLHLRREWNEPFRPSLAMSNTIFHDHPYYIVVKHTWNSINLHP